MAATTKCTCPECKVTFNPPKGAAGKINCPICKARIKVPASNGQAAASAPLPLQDDDERSGSSGMGALIGVCVAGAVILFLIVGAALGLYVLRAAKTEPAEVAQSDKQKQPDDPNKDRAVTPDPIVERPDPIERPRDKEPIVNKDKDPIERPKDRDKKAPEPELTPAEKKQVKINAAIDRGIAYLRKDLERYLSKMPTLEGPIFEYHDGIVSFASMTLLECGAKADDPLIQEAAAFVRKHVSEMKKTYNVSATLLFLEKLGDPKDLPPLKLLAIRLVAAQQSTGVWSYDCPSISDAEERALFAYLEKVEPRVNLALQGVKDPTGAARMLPPRIQNVAVVRWLNGLPPTPSIGDNSNSQFAMLALWVAARRELPVRSPMALGAAYFATTQAPDGSWEYTSANPGRASMTCAGLLGTAVGRNIGKKPNEVSVQRGIKYLASVFQGRAPGVGNEKWHGHLINADAADDLYYLWSLERVCLIYGIQKINGKDWYEWESDVLLRTQKSDGSWSDQHPGSVGTSFALLILKRVNVVKDLKIEDKIKDDVNKAANIKDTK